MKLNRHLGIFTVALTLTTPAVAKDADPLVKVQTYKIEKVNLSGELKFPATVTPLAQGKLTSEVSGIITTVRKTLGAKVGAHEAVFFVRQNQVGMEYNDYAVRSPIAGVLSQLDYSVGQFLQAGTIAGEVIDPDRMKVTLEAPAQDIIKMKVGLKADFSFDSVQVPLKITGLSPVANPTTGTSLVELEPVQKATKSLRAGSVGRTTVYLPPHNGFAVPARAIMTLGPDTFVRVVDKDDHVHFVKVGVGPLVREMQVIQSGLNLNDEVIVKASGHIKEGDQVVRSDDKASPPS